ncbi:MAG: 4a-hydroxytetrahydrobiopterin dehydratase [Actinobacteria bacterium]|nr:4a-hydroxytetrahydrobiopterin dehydratase [Actinomycetota bacterium]
MDALTEQQIEEALTSLPGWEFDGEVVTKTYAWASFREAIDFVNDIADLAEDANHHPDIEVYFDEVVISFRTHSAEAVTDADVRMAGEVEDLASDYEDDFEDDDFEDDLELEDEDEEDLADEG